MTRFPGALGFSLLRTGARLRDKLATWFVSGAFAACGPRTMLEFPCRIQGPAGISLGAGVYIGRGSWLATQPKQPGASAEPRLRLDDGVCMSGQCVLSAAQEIVVEERVLFARNVYVSDHSHAFGSPGTPIMDQGLAKVAPVRIGRGAWLGQNVVVCPGVTIGAGAVIGAGSLVNRDVPAHALAVGTPARVVRVFGSPAERDPSLLGAP